MIRYATASPRPRPLWPRPERVEKNGSKIRASVVSSIPCPVSRTSSITVLPGSSDSLSSSSAVVRPTPARVRSRSSPPPGIESRALSARLRITCSSCPLSARIPPSPSASSSSTLIPSPIMGWSMRRMPSTISLRSSSSGVGALGRPNAMSCWVSAAARSAAFRISTASLRRASSSGIADARKSANPTMIISMLLKSCETPTASRPSASIFCASRTWVSARCHSLRSCTLAAR